MPAHTTSRAHGKSGQAPQPRKTSPRKTARAVKSRHGVLADSRVQFSDEEWNDMVATAAYFRAESRGFEGGSPEDDWYEAEAELREQLAGAGETFDMDESADTTRGDNER
jgi:hypothetical protein